MSIENEPERNSLLHRILVSDELIPAESITVWIDPLDATKEYTEGLKQYVTTMVGIGSFYSSLDQGSTDRQIFKKVSAISSILTTFRKESGLTRVGPFLNLFGPGPRFPNSVGPGTDPGSTGSGSSLDRLRLDSVATCEIKP